MNNVEMLRGLTLPVSRPTIKLQQLKWHKYWHKDKWTKPEADHK
jgi:hypothetical protein